MESRKLPALLALTGVVVAVVLFLVLKDDTADEDTTVAQTTTETTGTDPDNGQAQQKPEKPKKPAVPVIEIRDGQPVGGVAEIEVKAGERIRFTVSSDVAEEVHLHGYDVSKDVEAGGKVSFDVPATIEGGFEVELEHSVVPIAQVTVTPA